MPSAQQWRRAGLVGLALVVGAACGYAASEIHRVNPLPAERVFDAAKLPPGQVDLEVVWRGAARDKTFAITFDDGPDPAMTPAVLDVLAKHNTKATFFVLGEFAQSHPSLIRRLVAGGHEVGVHGWNHDKLTLAEPKDIQGQLERALKALEQAGAGPVKLFRPTYGRIDTPGLTAAANLGLRVVEWSQALHGGDQARADADAIAGNPVPGSIILCHDGRMIRDQALLDGLDRLLTGMDQAKFRGVTVSQLMGWAGD